MTAMTRKEMLKTLALTPLAGAASSLVDLSLQGKMFENDKGETDLGNVEPLFSLSSVRLFASPFKEAQKTDHQYLLSLEPDRLLFWHRKSAGLAPKAEHYGGWENGGSNILGHYMSASSHMYQATDDEALQKKVNYVVDELKTCQQHLGTGALFNDPGMQENFNKMRHGTLKFTQLDPAFPLVNGQNPWYGIHKVMAGLRDAYQLCDNQIAKNMLIRFADWAWNFSNHLTTDQFQAMLDVEHGGMPEVVADIYNITGKQKYFDLAKRFVHQRIAEPLSKDEDILYPEHSNATIPKFSGCARINAVHENNTKLEKEAAINFWDTVLDDHTLATGGNGEFERFGEAGEVSNRIGYSSAETCCTYNMIKLSKHLYLLNRDTKYINYYERALYNHLLGGIGPEEGMFTYYYSHRPGYFKTFSTAFNSNWCCVGTGMENPAKYGQIIYTRNNNDLFINLFISSQLNWEEKGLKIRQETKFPDENTVRLMIEDARNEKMGLKIRNPSWTSTDPKISVNGQDYQYETDEQGYISINRIWNENDKITVTLPMSLRVESTPDNPNISALFYGPILLAGDFGKTGMDEIKQRVQDHWANDNLDIDLVDMPVLVGSKSAPSHWIKREDTDELSFIINTQRDKDPIKLKPLYKIIDERYSIYWDMYNPEEWKNYKKSKKRFVRDQVQPGNQDDEEAHNFSGEKVIKGQTHFRSFRGAKKQGWFSYDMHANSERPLVLMLQLWGGGYSPSPKGVFDVFVDAKKITTIDLADKRTRVNWVDTNHPMRYYHIIESIPPQLTEGKKYVTVKINPLTDVKNSGIFSCKLVTTDGLNIKSLLREKLR